MPIGTEALIHWRSTVEDAAKTGVIEPVVFADLDLENFFNSVEWPAIRASLRMHFPEASQVVEWEQREAGTMVLADGSEHSFNRGAEQGGPLGSLKAALPLGNARGRVAATRPQRVCDEWYIDDDQLVCAPAMLDPLLRAFDAELETLGASRGTGPDVKSSARLVCPAERVNEFERWASEYVRQSCKIHEANAPAVALGAIIGDDSSIRQGAVETCRKIQQKRAAIACLEHAPSELILTRRCADVGNINYWLRCYGDRLRGTASERFDADLRAAVEETLGGPLADVAWWQANLGVSDSGLGMKTAHDTALPAFIGSRIASRPLVRCMFTHIETAELGIAQVLLDAYDTRTAAAVEMLVTDLPPDAEQEIRDIVADGYVVAARSWRATMREEQNDDMQGVQMGVDNRGSSVRQAGSVAPGLVLDAGAEDEEHPNYGGGTRGSKVQRKLAKLIDGWTREGLRAHHEQAGSTLDCERLDDLAHPDTSHSWIWATCKVHGPVIEEDTEYIEAIRVRLGAGGPSDVAVRGLCGRAQLDTAGGHATCCALGESTAGHNAVRDCIFRFAADADPATELEPQDLVPSQPRARPADVLTPAAFPGCVAALDVGVVAPAAHPGVDAAEQMYGRKREEREPIRAELEQQNIWYQPIVWTTYGRPHAQAMAAMKGISKRLARRRGCKPATVLAQMQFAVGVCLARRAARMSLACQPRRNAEASGAELATAIGLHFVMEPGDTDAVRQEVPEDTDGPTQAATTARPPGS